MTLTLSVHGHQPNVHDLYVGINLLPFMHLYSYWAKDWQD